MSVQSLKLSTKSWNLGLYKVVAGVVTDVFGGIYGDSTPQKMEFLKIEIEKFSACAAFPKKGFWAETDMKHR